MSYPFPVAHSKNTLHNLFCVELCLVEFLLRLFFFLAEGQSVFIDVVCISIKKTDVNANKGPALPIRDLYFILGASSLALIWYSRVTNFYRTASQTEPKK